VRKYSVKYNAATAGKKDVVPDATSKLPSADEAILDQLWFGTLFEIQVIPEFVDV